MGVSEHWTEEAYQSKHSGRLVSLLDMLRFYADKFHDATNAMAAFRAFLQQIPEDKNGTILGGVSGPSMVDKLRILSNMLEEINLPVSKKNAEYLIGRLSVKDPVIDRDLRFAVDHAFRLLNDEISFKIFFCVSPENINLVEQSKPIFGEDVDTAFPSSSFDVAEAGKCYALGRETACVMHLMRALETPLQLMSSELGVSSIRDNWGNLLKEIDIAIIALPNSDIRKSEFSEAAIQFRHFKNAWRDHAMHARGKYSPDEALNVLAASKALMNVLSKRFSE
jgi:hypothetical protein